MATIEDDAGNITRAAQALLTAQSFDILSRLEDLSRTVQSSPPETLLRCGDGVVRTVTSKILVAQCVPQPCLQAIHFLTSVGRRYPDTDGSNNHIGSFFQLVAPTLLKLLWQYTEDHPTIAGAVEAFFLVMYEFQPRLRKACRAALFGTLGSYVAASGEQSATLNHNVVSNLVVMLMPMVRGLRHPLATCHEDDLVMYLAPLLRTSKYANQGSMSASEFFIGPLSTLISTMLGKIEEERLSEVMVRLFRAFLPGFQEGKLHSSIAVVNAISKLVDLLDGEAFEDVHEQLIDVCCRACASDYPSLAVKGYKLFLRQNFVHLIARRSSDVMESMSKTFGRHGAESHWDAEVRRHMLAVWRFFDGWDYQTAEEEAANTNSEGGRALCFYDVMVRGPFHGDAGAVHAFRALLEEKVLADDSAAVALEQQREERRNYTKICTAMRRATRQMNFVFGRNLGSGAFGAVKYAKLIEPDVAQSLWYEVAIKQVSKAVIREQDCEAEFRMEVDIHRSLSDASEGKHVVPLYHVIEDAQFWYMVTEYCPYGDVYDSILANSGFTVNTQDGPGSQKQVKTRCSWVWSAHGPWIKVLLSQIAESLAFMHRHGYYYGDLKPENVLLFRDPHQPGGFSTALCDFGAAISLSEMQQTSQFSGTMEYCAPELLDVLVTDTPNKHINGIVCDAWSFGCLCVQLITGKLPFQGQNMETLLKEMRCSSSWTPQQREDRWGVVDNGECSFVSQLLCVDPLQRYTVEQWLVEQGHHRSGSHQDEVVTVPPTLVAGGHVSRNSGRRESMMWKKASIEDQRVSSICSGTESQLPEEDEGVSPIAFSVRDTIPDVDAGSVRGGGRGNAVQPGRFPSGPNANVAQYFTVMPGRR